MIHLRKGPAHEEGAESCCRAKSKRAKAANAGVKQNREAAHRPNRRPRRQADRGGPVVVGRARQLFRPARFIVEGASNAEGRFEMQAPLDWKPNPPSRRLADSLWILAPGKDLKVVPATDGLIQDMKPASLTVQLDSATGTTTYQVNDPEDRPVAGAILDPPNFVCAGGTRSFPDAVREQLRTTTDKSGRGLGCIPSRGISSAPCLLQPPDSARKDSAEATPIHHPPTGPSRCGRWGESKVAWMPRIRAQCGASGFFFRRGPRSLAIDARQGWGGGPFGRRRKGNRHDG